MSKLSFIGSGAKKIGRKTLVVFDLDGTLTESKANMDREMASLIRALLAEKKVAIIGGGRYEQFRSQFVAQMRAPSTLLRELYLFPTSSTSFYRYRRGWRNVYAHDLPLRVKKEIYAAFEEVFERMGYAHPKRVYGAVIEDRGTQITFSALGQRAPVRGKKSWNKKYNAMRLKMRDMLQRILGSLEVRAGGLTSIDVTRRGIDKAYGIRQIEKQLHIPRRDMVFVGDAIYPGGNDYAVVKAGVDYVKVSGPAETKKFIRNLLAA